MQGTHEGDRFNLFALLRSLKPTKEKILATAINMFSIRGYSAVSIRDITHVVGIKESSLYNHFQSKEEILETIYTLFILRFRQLIPTEEQLDVFLGKTTPEGFLVRGYQLFMDMMNDDVIGQIWIIVQMEQYRDTRAADIIRNVMMKESISLIETALQKMMDRGDIETADPSLLASEYQYAVFAMGSEYCLLKCLGLDTTEVEQKFHNHVRFFLQSVGKR